MTQLALAIQKAGIVPDDFKANEKRKWGKSARANSFTWEHPDFGQLDVTAINFTLDEEVHQVGPNTWVKIYPKRAQIDAVRVGFTGEVNPGITLLHCKAGLVTNMMEEEFFPKLEVPIEWKPTREEGVFTPHTRVKDQDNVDLLLLRKDGKFVQQQVSVVTRNGDFWLCMQEIYCGQIARSTDGTTTVLPLFDENAYPDSNYLKTFPKMGPQVVDYAVQLGAVTDLSKVVAAEWAPQELNELPENMKKAAWLRGVVTFFNLVIGWGFALCEDGEMCMVHFSAVLDEDGKPVAASDEMPVLQPMMGIALKRKKTDRGYTATAIRTAD